MIEYKDILSACNVNYYSFHFNASENEWEISNTDIYLEDTISIQHVSIFMEAQNIPNVPCFCKNH